MLRQFSVRRVVGFFSVDWAGSLLLLGAVLCFQVPEKNLPRLLIALAPTLRQPDCLWLQAGSNDRGNAAQVLLAAALVWLGFLLLFGVYNGSRNGRLRAELLNVFLVVLSSTMTLAGIVYLADLGIQRAQLLAFFFLDAFLMLGSRIALWLFRRGARGVWGTPRRNVLVVGAGSAGQTVVNELRKHAWASLNPVGFVDDDSRKQGRDFEGLRVLGTLDQIVGLIEEHSVQETVVALPLGAHARLVQVCRDLQRHNANVHVVPDLFSLSFPGATLDGFGGIPVISLGLPGIHGPKRTWKRIFDSGAALLLLALLWPLAIIVAIAIKLESAGPVIYRQQRIGENGREFTMLKFRSMRVDADPQEHKDYVTKLIKENLDAEQLGEEQSSLKLAHDSRITRVGRIIRKTSIDELPQIWNVLRGEMSLVGPRPPIAYEVEVYQEWHKRRLEAIPGITGLWQVKGRNQVSFDEMVRMDLEYIEQQSLWLDIKILLQTPVVALLGRGAG